LVDEFQPEAIYLFGSHAWGQPQPDSDLDIMIIVADSQQSPTERARRAYRSLRGIFVPVDVLVKTRAEFERYRSVYASLEAQVHEKGVLLYGRKTRPGKKLAEQSPA
jgi:predicted nucleotidyltransferase